MKSSTTAHSTRRPLSARALAAVGAAALTVAFAPTAAASASVVVTAPTSVLAAPHAALAPAPQAAAVGKLAPTGCSGGGGAVSCDLYAKTGTTTLPGTDVPIWGFSSTADAVATAPGPVLVVDQGDTVKITLHNSLQQNVSLALPGQPADQVSSGLNDRTGVPTGGTATYTFKAGRAGTFLYEAGHTADGSRQVAMGLAGALVVRSADGTVAGQSYDDESVMVLSEIDPALNADPDTFDMRNFHPGWRLINGRPFPSTPAVPTDQGHKVLLRYVNVGSMTHPMSLLGADQLQLTDDGHALGQPRRETVAAIDAGATADSLVQMPSGPETKVTLFEEGSHLDNVGQTEQDPTKVAPGGMMTFLDTNAPPVSSDIVGPAVSHAKVSPAVSDGLSDVTISADLSDAKSGSSKISAAEFVVDDDGETAIAAGQGTSMSGTFDAPTAQVTGTLPAHPSGTATCADTPVPVVLECLPAGKHVIYVRGMDAAKNWGVVSSVVLNLPKTGPATTNGSASPSPANGTKAVSISATGDDSAAEGKIDRAEYFLDTVGADGTGTDLPINRTATVVSEDGQLPAAPPSGQTCTAYPASVSCLTEGTHHLFVHSHDDLGATGLWGPPLDIAFTVDKTGPTVLAAAVGPNPTNGLISAPSNPGYLYVSAQISDQSTGGALQSNLVGAEGFFSPTGAPADGTGFGLTAVDGKYDSPTEAAYGLIPITQAKAKPDGTYIVYVHGKDAAGNWGDRLAVNLVVDKTAPALGSPVTASPNPTNGAAVLTLSAPLTKDVNLATAEFWTGTADPGVGKATRVSVSTVNGQAVATIPLAGVTPGSPQFNLRVQDPAGNWSNAVSTTVTVSRPNAIFSDNFDSGNLNSWSTRTSTGSGTTSVTTAGGSPALTVTAPGTHYVTDNTPVGETGYHASFSLTPGTLSSTGTTVFDARAGNNGGGALVLSVAFRKSGGGNQVRLSMGNANGAWVNLPAGSPTVRVDWSSGPGNGPVASRGTTKLSLNGTTASTLTGNSSNLRVESARLGLLATGATGTAYVDDFISTRNTLP